MAKGSLEPDQIEKIKAQLHHEVAENHRLPLPTDMVEVEVDKYQYIKYLDDYVETLNPSDRIRNKYERLKAEALV
ncbi:hypothetical protein KA013_03310 [Patescibacteria group bacterium]|nr:hypothetical protein [Patescibacteria group bacterium]